MQVTLPNGFVGEFIRVRVKMDVGKKLTRVVRLIKAGETKNYSVKYEILPTFCYECGMMGHWYEECGTGEHDRSKFEWGPFLLSSRGMAGGGQGSRFAGLGRGDHTGEDYVGGRGRGRGRRGNLFGGQGQANADAQYNGAQKANEERDTNAPSAKGVLTEYDPSISWWFNALAEKNAMATSENEGSIKEDPLILGKRSADDSNTGKGAFTEVLNPSSAIVPVGNT